MTPKTHALYEQTMQKARLASLPIQLGDCQAVDLFTQAAMHLLLLESFERLCAVVVEGTGCTVEWINGRAP